MVDFHQIAKNIKARKDAESLIELAGEQPVEFYRALAEIAASKLPSPVVKDDKVKPLTDIQAIKFESEPMPYGKHKGTSVGLTPCDYLEWFNEGDLFKQTLHRYLMSSRYKQRRESE